MLTQFAVTYSKKIFAKMRPIQAKNQNLIVLLHCYNLISNGQIYLVFNDFSLFGYNTNEMTVFNSLEEFLQIQPKPCGGLT